jgi:AraC-like DNA-binding protein
VRHAITPSAIVAIEPGELLQSEGFAGLVDYDMVLVTPARVERTIAQDPFLEKRRHFRPAVIDDPALAAALRNLARALAEPLLRPARVDELLTSFLARAFKRACNPEGGRGEPASIDLAVARARDAIAARFAEKLRLDEIAAIGGVSKFHLERAFHARMGVPVYQYLKRVRVSRALEQIRQGARPLDVSTRVGFADQPHITRVFQQELGFTPRQYGLGRGATSVGTPGPRPRLHQAA